MKLKIYLRMLLAAVAALFVATACSDSDDDPGKGGPDKPTEPLTFKINVTDIEKDQAKLSVTPSDPTAIYYYNAVKKSIYDGLGSDKAFLDDDLAFLQSEAAKQQMTLSAYLQAKSGRGTATYTLTGLEKTTEYYAYVYGIKLDGTVTSDLVKDLFTSGEGKGEDPGPGPGGEGPKFRTFAASAGDRDGKNTESCITVQIATETRITAGKMYINTSAVVNSALGEGYTYETLIKEFGTAMDAQMISIINQCVDDPDYVLASTIPNLEAGEWTVICMVSDDNGDTTEHASVTLGGDGGNGPSLDMSLTVGDDRGANTDTNLTIMMKAPDATSGKYGLFSKSQVDALLEKGATYEAIIKTEGTGSVMSPEYLGYVTTGGLALTIQELSPGTAYTAIVLVSNANGDTVKALSATTTGGSTGDGPELTVTADPGDNAGLNTDTKIYWGAYAPTAQSAMYGIFETADVQANLDKGFTYDQIVSQVGKAMSAEWLEYLTTDPGIGVTTSKLTPNTSYTVIVKATDASGNSTTKYAVAATTQALEPTVIELNNLAKGDMEYWGDSYGIPTNDYANWNLYLYDASIDLDKGTGTGDAIMIELNTAKNVTTEITPGTYTVMSDRYANNFVAFSCVPGYTVQEAGKTYAMGTWYIKDLVYENMLTSGSVVVSKSGENYTITFELLDQSTNTTIKGTYRGTMTYRDATVNSVSAKIPGQMAAKKQYKTADMRSGLNSDFISLSSFVGTSIPSSRVVEMGAVENLSVGSLFEFAAYKFAVGEKVSKFRKVRNE